MRSRVIHFVGPGHEVAVEISQRPHRLPLGIDRFGDLANLLGDLRIAGQIEEELCVRCAKKPFDDRAISGFCPGSGGLRAGVVGKQRLEVYAAEVRATINDECLRKATAAPS